MIELLAGLGGRLTERWMTVLVLPGLFYLAVATLAYVLGHAHAFDARHLAAALADWAQEPFLSALAGQVIVLVVVLVAAAAVGLAAQALNRLTELLSLAPDWHIWPTPARRVAERLTQRRRRRWDAHHAVHQQLTAQARALAVADHRARVRAERAGEPVPEGTDRMDLRRRRHAAHRAYTAISSQPPQRPTWSGDQIHALTQRIHRDLGVHLPSLWPYLWSVLPDAGRADITAARTQLTQATTLQAWAILYLPLAYWWWPALPLAAGIGLTGWRRTRTATALYTHHIQATTRLHLSTLAAHLGIDTADTTPPGLGAALTHHLHTRPD